MAKEIVFVGAGPIGLWTAIQIKLKNPEINIVFKEKKEKYTRTHTLLLKPESFADCIKDETGVIEGIIAQLKTNPHIRTDHLETSFRSLAEQLGIKIDTQAVSNIEKDILSEYPDAALVVGADGVRSAVRTQVFGAENTIREELAYTAQIKYFVKGDALDVNKLLQDYPLLKHSNYLSFVNVGKQTDGKTPVTIQMMIDKKTYELIRAKTTYGNPIKLFADDIEEQLPAELLNDIKTQLGFRLSNNENIIINDVNLTATELPQQRCKQVTKFADGRYYAVIGDAALALSYFKGMNRGLQLASKFAKTVTNNWDNIVAKNESVFTQYEQEYSTFAADSFKKGHETNRLVRILQSLVNVGKCLPFQFVYFDNNEIADFHRHFGIIHQTCQFYLDAQIGDIEVREPTAQNIKNWLAEQMPIGLPILKENLLREAVKHQSNPTLYKAVMDLANIDFTQLNFYEKAYLGLALSKTRNLLESPTSENYQAYVKFANRLATVHSGVAIMMSSILQCIAGAVAIAFGIIAAIGSGGVAAPLIGAGVLLTGHGIYKLIGQSKRNPIQKDVTKILQECPPIETTPNNPEENNISSTTSTSEKLDEEEHQDLLDNNGKII